MRQRHRGTVRPIGFWYRVAVVLLKPPMLLLTRRDWRGAEHLGHDGEGIVAVTNHVSHFDPLAFAHFLYDNGRPPRFLAKAGLFRVFFVGQVLRGAKQIPVYRQSADAARAYSAAVDAVRHGECVAFYPEATLTRDPGQWPMRGKTGAARVALATGAPVIPIAQWGPQWVLEPYGRRLHLFPRKVMHVSAGPPVDLSEFMGKEIDAALLRAVSDRIMTDITTLLAEIRGEQPPAVLLDPEAAGLPATGNPHARPRRGAGGAGGPDGSPDDGRGPDGRPDDEGQRAGGGRQSA